jgi:hypothetical protein
MIRCNYKSEFCYNNISWIYLEVLFGSVYIMKIFNLEKIRILRLCCDKSLSTMCSIL